MKQLITRMMTRISSSDDNLLLFPQTPSLRYRPATVWAVLCDSYIVYMKGLVVNINICVTVFWLI